MLIIVTLKAVPGIPSWQILRIYLKICAASETPALRFVGSRPNLNSGD